METKNKKNIEAGDVKKIKIKDIKIKVDCYPREGIDWDLVKENYAIHIERLPKITINQDNILIDGRHRLEAYKILRITEIECVIEKTENDDDIFKRAVELNAFHGKQLSAKEKRDAAKKLFNGSNGKHLVKILSVSQDCFNKWTRDNRKKRNEELEEDIIQEYLKAETTQEQVAEKFSTSKRKVSEVKAKASEKINLLLRNKEDVSDEDQEKYTDIYNFKPFSTNFWGVYSNENPLNESEVKFDKDRFNRSLLYYFTEPFDIVYMPEENRKLIDACREFRRRYCTGKTTVSPNLVFLDGKDDTLEGIVKLLKEKMKKGHIAIKTDSVEQDNTVNKMMEKLGFSLNNRVIMPYANLVVSYSMQQGYDSLLIFKVG